jgi:UDP-N-acetylmuramoylalanine--D-glutamate ligase
VNDSQATIPDAAVRALQAFPSPRILIAGGLAKLENADAFDELGQAIAAQAALLVSIGRDGNLIEEAARRAGMNDDKIVAGENLTKAFEVVTMRASPGTTVILSPACASFDQFSNYEKRGEAFRALVSEFATNFLSHPTAAQPTSQQQLQPSSQQGADL